MEGIFETQERLDLEWFDPRLKLHNLQPTTNENMLMEEEKRMIWIPSVTFVNTAGQEQSVQDNSSLVTVDRRGSLQMSSEEEVKNIYIYQGEENPLKITRVYSTKWLCSMGLFFVLFSKNCHSTYLIMKMKPMKSILNYFPYCN